ncbi:MAG: hypothetical protein H0T62_09575 [Parachlamydiaceae bacterium]|nr:hypothetical protein [Parachlamydiaceae bacterium]
MDAIQVTKNRVDLSLSQEEIFVLRNGLSIVCIEIEEWEFETRLGNYLEEAKILLDSLTSVLEKMKEIKEDTA